MEASSGKLHSYELRCPYCRNIHASLVPYYEDLGLAKIHGVNCLDPTLASGDPTKVCCFVDDATNPVICAGFYGFKVNCYDKKVYCYYHNKIVNNTHLIKIKEEKQKIKDEKQKVKEEKQKVKEEKHKVKEEKQQLKNVNEDVQNTIVTPMIIGEGNVVVPCGCIATLKTGARKGQACNKRVHQDAMCKLHYCINLK